MDSVALHMLGDSTQFLHTCNRPRLQLLQIATLTGIVQSYAGLIVCRLLLGLFEGGTSRQEPAITLNTDAWFRALSWNGHISHHVLYQE